MENNPDVKTVQDQKEKQIEDDEISLIDLFAVLLKYRKMIIGITIAAAVFIVIFSIGSLLLPPEESYLPNQYTSQAHMLINDSSSENTLSSLLSSSGLASLAGIKTSSTSTYSSLAVYLSTSNPILDAIVDNFQILDKPEFKKSKYPRFDSRKMVKKSLETEIDTESNVFTIAYTDIDPVFAQSIVNFAVDWMQQRFDELGIDKNKIQKENLEKNIDSSYQEIQRLQKEANKIANSVAGGNSSWNIPSVILATTRVEMELEAQKEVYKQLKTQYELLKVQMQSETPVFQIIERPEVPDRKSTPSRGMICIIAVFAAFFISVFVAFLLNALHNIKNDPEAMEKLSYSRKTLKKD